jgi:D-alanyl-D-alanine carboxypeptidase
MAAADYFEEFGVSPAALLARGLVRYADAGALEIAGIGDDGREHRLAPRAARAWRQLEAAAARDGETLAIVSAFRSIERQAEIVRAKLRSGQSIDEILEVSAFPGFSEHHTGLAVDVSAPACRPLTVEFEQTSAFRWLSGHAGAHGFRLSYPRDNRFGYRFEPWHWCHDAPL